MRPSIRLMAGAIGLAYELASQTAPQQYATIIAETSSPSRRVRRPRMATEFSKRCERKTSAGARSSFFPEARSPPRLAFAGREPAPITTHAAVMLVKVRSCAGFWTPAAAISPAHGRPASKKRQGTKSRSAGRRLGGERYGDFRLAPHSMLARHRGSAARIAARGGWRERGRGVPSGVWRVSTGAGRMDCPELG